MKIFDYMKEQGSEFEEEAREEIAQGVVSTLVASEEFIHLIDSFNPNWSNTMVKATCDPSGALKDLKRSLKAFLLRNDYTIDTFVDQLTYGVLCSPEFIWCAEQSGPDWLETLDLEDQD